MALTDDAHIALVAAANAALLELLDAVLADIAAIDMRGLSGDAVRAEVVRRIREVRDGLADR